MLKPARMEKIVRSMSSVLSCPLTIKVPSIHCCFLAMNHVCTITGLRYLFIVRVASGALPANIPLRLSAL